MMDFEKLQESVLKLESAAKDVDGKNALQAMRTFASGLKSILQSLLKDRKELVRPGQVCRDAAAKNLIPGDIAARADVLLTKWGGSVTPTDEASIKDGAEKFKAVAEKLIPVLKAYRKDAK
jgi:hypothetical protein